MKGRCYPKYSYISFYIFSIVLLAFAIAPIFIKTNDPKYIIIILFSNSLLSFISALINMQTYEIKDNEITIRTVFGILTKMNLKCAIYEIVNLDTYTSKGGPTQKKWICLYDNNYKIDRFKNGGSNKKNKHRLQIIYSEALIQKLRAENVAKLY